MEKHVFICKDDIENMLTAVFDAFSYRNKMNTDDIGIIVSDDGIIEREMFCDYENVETDINKALSTVDNIRNRLGEYVYDQSIKILCHYDTERVYTLFKFLEICFKKGGNAIYKLKNPYIMRAMELARKTQNETHLYLGVTRFQETYGILCATIEPKCNAIPIITGHFADRYPGENWIIYDKTRNVMAVHRALGSVELIKGSPEFLIDSKGFEVGHHDEYVDLWQVFFESIAIDERYNPKCQNNLLPLWMRKHMTEFTDKRVQQ